MNLHNLTPRIALVAALSLLAGTVFAAPVGDIGAGKTKAQTCAACHGADGNTTIDPMYPRLAGQYADYLSKALHDYKSGARANPIMAGFAGTLSEQDIADLAAFYAAQPAATLHDISHLE